MKLDDGFGEHPKIAQLSDSALALWVTGLAYCNRNLTDGFIPRMVGLGQLRYCEGNALPFIKELEEAGLWAAVDGGWQVHDYLEFQPSRDEVRAERLELSEKRAAAGRKGAMKRWGESPGQDSKNGKRDSKPVATGRQTGWQTDDPVPVPVPVPVTEPLPTVGVRNLTELKNTLVDLFGEPPPQNWSVYNRVAAWIRDQGGTPEDVRWRAARIAEEWGKKAATVTSLEKYWNRYTAQVGQISDADVEKFAREQKRQQRMLEAAELERRLPG